MQKRHQDRQPTRRGVKRDQERLVALAGKEDVRHVRTAGLDRELLAAFTDHKQGQLAGFHERK
jgi:hypothetical protein